MLFEEEKKSWQVLETLHSTSGIKFECLWATDFLQTVPAVLHLQEKKIEVSVANTWHSNQAVNANEAQPMPVVVAVASKIQVQNGLSGFAKW